MLVAQFYAATWAGKSAGVWAGKSAYGRWPGRVSLPPLRPKRQCELLTGHRIETAKPRQCWIHCRGRLAVIRFVIRFRVVLGLGEPEDAFEIAHGGEPYFNQAVKVEILGVLVGKVSFESTASTGAPLPGAGNVVAQKSAARFPVGRFVGRRWGELFETGGQVGDRPGRHRPAMRHKRPVCWLQSCQTNGLQVL